MYSQKDLVLLPLLNNFRLRGANGTRMDGLTDGIFALSVAVLLISSSVPTNFQELLQFVYDLMPFAVCIVFIYWIWNSLNKFNINYGMEDSITCTLKMTLMFFVLFYVYPLKFLMSWQVKYFSAIFSGSLRERYADLNNMIPFAKLPELMIIYGVGFFAIFFILYLLHRRADRQRVPLLLNEIEILETQSAAAMYFSTAMVGLISVIIAFVSILLQNPLGAIASGVAYNLIWIFSIFHMRKRKVALRQLEEENSLNLAQD